MENEKRQRPVQSFSLPPDVVEAAKKAARRERLPLSRWVERVLAAAAGLS